MFHRLSLYKFVASGGLHLNNIAEVIPHSKTNEWLMDCKFIIAFENQIKSGYVTEKAFQAYYAGSVPIYYGVKNYKNDINSNAIVSVKDFNDDIEASEYIKKLDMSDEEYCKIWNENILPSSNNNYDELKKKLSIRLYSILKKL